MERSARIQYGAGFAASPVTTPVPDGRPVGMFSAGVSGFSSHSLLGWISISYTGIPCSNTGTATKNGATAKNPSSAEYRSV